MQYQLTTHESPCARTYQSLSLSSRTIVSGILWIRKSCKTMKYYWIRYLQKFSLLGLLLLLLYLTWTPQKRSYAAREEGEAQLHNRPMEQPVTVSMDLFRLRQKTIERHCKGVNVTKIAPPRTIIYSRRLHVAYCPIYTVASTAMKYAMALAEGKKIYSHVLYNVSLQQAIHSDAQKLALRSAPERVNGQADVLLIIRDPWQRLVSAYRKLVEANKPHHSSDSRDCQRLLGMTREITFELFLQCIIRTADTGAKLSTHLQPTDQVCSVCRIQYTRIVRFENILSELTTLFQPNAKRPEYEGLLRAFHTCPLRTSAAYDMLPYLTTVSENSKKRIQEIYKQDFLVFGYPFLEDLKGL